MMQRFAAGLVLALTCAAQTWELAPEVLLLRRIKDHMTAQLDRLPNYTCLETVARFRAPREKPPKPQDVLKLEVVYSDGQEWYASPGDRSFTATHPSQFAGGGFTATGTFALDLHNIFAADAALCTWRGREVRGGRPAVRYDFRLPRSLKALAITVPGGQGTVGEAGSFWADPETLDVFALEIHAEDIPPFLPVAESVTRVAFARTRIAGRDALLPQTADLQLLSTNGNLNFDHADFTHCRAYQAQSVLHFGGASDSSVETPAHPPRTATDAVPAFLPVTVLLASPITDRDAVGTLIRGTVAADVRHKGRVVLPRGSPVRGRIRVLERYDDRTWSVGLEFTEVEAQGVPLRFYAELTALDRSRQVRRRVSEKREVVSMEGTVVVTLPPLAGVASFFVSGKSFTLPAGFQTVWLTRGLLRQ